MPTRRRRMLLEFGDESAGVGVLPPGLADLYVAVRMPADFMTCLAKLGKLFAIANQGPISAAMHRLHLIVQANEPARFALRVAAQQGPKRRENRAHFIDEPAPARVQSKVQVKREADLGCRSVSHANPRNPGTGTGKIRRAGSHAAG